MNMQQWLANESDRDQVIALRPLYVDMAEDLAAGLLLSQIIYWFTPDKNGRTKLRVRKEDNETGETCLWIAKAYKDWWDEVRLTEKQARTALEKLQEKGLVITQVNKFNGSPTTHIRLDEDRFMQLLEEELPSGEPVLPDRANGNTPNGQMESTETGKSLTETRSESTSKTTNKEKNAAISSKKLPSFSISNSALLVEPVISPEGEVFDDALIPELKALGVKGANLQTLSSEEYALDTWAVLERLEVMLANHAKDKRHSEITNPPGWLYHMVVGGGLEEDRAWASGELEDYLDE